MVRLGGKIRSMEAVYNHGGMTREGKGEMYGSREGYITMQG